MIVRRQGGGELGLAGLLLCLGITVLVETTQTPVPATAGAAGPRVFPYAAGGLLVVVSLWLVVDIWLKLHRAARAEAEAALPTTTGAVLPGAGDGLRTTAAVQTVEAEDTRTDWRVIAVVLAVMAAYIVTLPAFGYFLSTALVFWGIAHAFGSRRRVRDPLIGLAVSAVIYVGFTTGLSIDLPVGSLFEGLS